MRISDWSSDVCSSDLADGVDLLRLADVKPPTVARNMDIEADAIGGIPVDGRRLECRGDDIALLVGDADDIEQLVVDARLVYPARIGRGAADAGLLVAEMWSGREAGRGRGCRYVSIPGVGVSL